MCIVFTISTQVVSLKQATTIILLAENRVGTKVETEKLFTLSTRAA